MKTGLLVLVAVVASGVASGARQPYSRYRPIVDRQMFGDPPEGFDPTKPPSEAVSSRAAQKAGEQLSKEQEKLKSAIRFSMINVTPSGETAVGFTDSSVKPPVNYYLRVGESRDNWTVREADAGKGTMTIVKDDVEVSLSLGGDSAKGAGKTSAAGSTGGAGSDPHAPTPGCGGSIGSKRRFFQREQQAQAQAAQREWADSFMKKMDERDAKRREEEAARREEEKAELAAERAELQAQLQAGKDELKREREERKKAEEAKSEDGESQTPEQDSNQ